MTVVKDKIQDAQFDKIVGDKSVDDVHVVRFAKIACCLDVKGLIDDDAYDGDRYEDVKHHTPPFGEIVDERLHALPFLKKSILAKCFCDSLYRV